MKYCVNKSHKVRVHTLLKNYKMHQSLVLRKGFINNSLSLALGNHFCANSSRFVRACVRACVRARARACVRTF